MFWSNRGAWHNIRGMGVCRINEKISLTDVRQPFLSNFYDFLHFWRFFHQQNTILCKFADKISKINKFYQRRKIYFFSRQTPHPSNYENVSWYLSILGSKKPASETSDTYKRFKQTGIMHIVFPPHGCLPPEHRPGYRDKATLYHPIDKCTISKTSLRDIWKTQRQQRRAQISLPLQRTKRKSKRKPRTFIQSVRGLPTILGGCRTVDRSGWPER